MEYLGSGPAHPCKHQIILSTSHLCHPRLCSGASQPLHPTSARVREVLQTSQCTPMPHPQGHTAAGGWVRGAMRGRLGRLLEPSRDHHFHLVWLHPQLPLGKPSLPLGRSLGMRPCCSQPVTRLGGGSEGREGRTPTPPMQKVPTCSRSNKAAPG